MAISHIIPVLALAGTAACLAHPTTFAHVPTAEPARVTAPATTISGYVELYAEDGIWLLSEGREIQLAGAADLTVQHAGLRVLVRGRFVRNDVFWVESAVRAEGTPVAVAR